MDHVGICNHQIHALLAAGYNVLCFDLPGHGLSSGDQAGIDSFADYVEVLAELVRHASNHLPPPHFVVAQSTGCSIAMDFLMHNDHHIEKLVLLAPLVIPKKWRWIKCQLHVLGKFISRVPRKFVKNSADEQFLHWLKHEDPLQTRWIKSSWVRALYQWQNHFSHSPCSDLDTLIIQGDNDQTVDWRYNLPQIEKKFTQSQRFIVGGANHHLMKEDEMYRQVVFAEIIDFLQE